jgi:hypothetical protein
MLFLKIFFLIISFGNGNIGKGSRTLSESGLAKIHCHRNKSQAKICDLKKIPFLTWLFILL